MLGEPGKTYPHLFFLSVKLDDGAGKECHKVALFDFGVHQVDGYRNGTFGAQCEDTCLQAA